MDYLVDSRILFASDYGVPQKEKETFLSYEMLKIILILKN